MADTTEAGNQANKTVLTDIVTDAEADFQDAEADVEAEATQTDKPDAGTQTGTITEEFVKEYSLSDSLVGKPYSELAKLYSSMHSDYSRKTQKLKELEGQLQNQLEEKENVSEQEVFDDEIPDPVLDPKGFGNWLDNYIKAKQPAQREDPVVKELSEDYRRRQEKLVYETIASSLPEDANTDETIADWAEANGVTEATLEQMLKSPQHLVSSVLTHFKAKKYDELAANGGRESGNEALRKTAESLKKAKNVRPSELNSFQRADSEQGKKKDIVSELADELEQEFRMEQGFYNLQKG